MPLPKKKKILFFTITGVLFISIISGWILFLSMQGRDEEEWKTEKSKISWDRIEETFQDIKITAQELQVMLGGELEKE